MTAVAERPAQGTGAPSEPNMFCDSVLKFLNVHPSLARLLAKKLAAGEVSFWSVPLDLKSIGVGAAEGDIASYQETIQAGKGRVLEAQWRLARAMRVNPLREAAFLEWVGRASGLPKEWADAMVTHLRPEVTYIRFFDERPGRKATLLVEHN